MAEKIITDKDYLYLSAMLKARESSMLTLDKMERMLQGSFAEAAKALLDNGYEDMSGMDMKGIEAILSAHRARIFDELTRFVPEAAVVDAFRMKYDYHNAKVIVKAEGAGVNGDYLLSDAGRVRPRALQDAFIEDDFRFMPPALGRAMQEAKSILARTDNPQLSDFAVDQAYFAEMLSLCEGLTSLFPGEYARTLIDSANLRTCVRTVRVGRDQDFLRTALTPGGHVGIERLAQSVMSGDGVAAAFAATPLAEAAQLGAEAMKGGPMTAFELACDNAVTAFLAGAKTVGFGAEAVVCYMAAVENEITAIRMILTGLASGLDPEQVKERLRDTYA